MFSLPPSLFANLLYAAVYFLQLQLWLVHEPVTPTMAACQPHLGAREGLEPLGSDLEGCCSSSLPTPKWLQTLPGPKMGLPGGHGYRMISNHMSHLAAL